MSKATRLMRKGHREANGEVASLVQREQKGTSSKAAKLMRREYKRADGKTALLMQRGRKESNGKAPASPKAGRWHKYFLGSGAGYRGRTWHHTLARGRRRDLAELKRFLVRKYGVDAPDAQAILCKNGRSALAIALKACLEPGAKVMVNGFTCYAVVEAVRAAECAPVYVDISPEDLNFNFETLAKAYEWGCKAVIIQNTLGNPVDIVAVEKFAKSHGLLMIEDLAHAAGVHYKDGREAGTVGVATVLSFGKEKSIDCVSGGAVVLAGRRLNNDDDAVVGGHENDEWDDEDNRGDEDDGRGGDGNRDGGDDGRDVATKIAAALDDLDFTSVEEPSLRPRLADHLRARFYPLFMVVYRGLSYVHLHGLWMRWLFFTHQVERSADNRLDTERRLSKFEARLALEQLKALRRTGERPIRDFRLVANRDEVLKNLRKFGYYFGGFWYEKPVSPVRYYQKVDFPEQKCTVATAVAAQIINFPTYYRKSELKKAYEIVERTGIVTGAPTGVKQARTEVPITGVG